MISRSRMMALGALLLALPAASLAAQGKSQERGRKDKDRGEREEVAVRVVFRDSDRAMYRDYFAKHRIMAEQLPPGIAKKLARGKPLPPGIAKRMVPAELIEMGPRVDKDVSFSIVGDAVIATRAGIVIDILAGVFGR